MAPSPPGGTAPDDPLDRLTEVLRDLPADGDGGGSWPSDPLPDGDVPDLVPPHLIRLRRYVVLRPLGRGGMGAVYLAHPRDLPDREVALKVLPPFFADDAVRLARFRNEATTASRVDHPGVVRVHEIGEEGGVHYQIQDLVSDGRTLQDWIREARDARLLPKGWYREVAVLFEKVAHALAAVHAANVVHRDIKPSNILLLPDGSPKVADFGLAKDLEGLSGLSGEGSPGTLNYKSPEQIDRRFGKVGPRSDVFGLGATLYEALTLTRLYPGDDPAEVQPRIMRHDVEDLRQARPGVPRDLSVICRRCLEREPGRRYQTMAEVADDLARHLRDEPIRAVEPGWVERGRKWGKRNPTATAVLLTVTAGAVVAGWFANENAALAGQKARLLGEQLLTTADVLASQASWDRCLAQLAAARASGVVPEGDILLREAEAHIASDNIAAARAALQQYGLQPDAPAPARAMLMQARILLAQGASQEAVRDQVVRARSAGLTGAELAFAEGLLANDPVAAATAFERALALAPAWREAHDHRIAAYLATTNYEAFEGAVAAFAILAPRDPAVQVGKAVAAVLAGDDIGVEAALAMLPEGGRTRDLARHLVAILAIAHGAPIGLLIQEARSATDVLKLGAGMTRAVFHAAALGKLEEGESGAVLRSNLAGMGETARAILTMLHEEELIPGSAVSLPSLLQGLVEPMPLDEAKARLEMLAAANGDALASLLLGIRALQPTSQRNETLANLRTACEHFQRAAKGRSLLPIVPRASRHYALQGLAIFGARARDALREEELASQRAEVSRLVGETLAIELTVTERLQQAATAEAHGLDQLALVALAKGRMESPKDPSIRREECRALLRLGAVGPARDLLPGLQAADRAALEAEIAAAQAQQGK